MQRVAVAALFLLSWETAHATTGVSNNSDVNRIRGDRLTEINHSDNNDSGRLMPEKSNTIPRSNTHVVESLNCGEQGDFNISLAIEKGIEFQAEFCSWKCYSGSADKQTRGNCRSKTPACVLCSCDSLCSQYSDCCDGARKNVSASTSDSTVGATPPSFNCFPIDERTAVYIIASCPARARSSSDSIQFNFTQQSSQTHTIPDALHKDSMADLECNSCLVSPELIHLVTSGTSGNTYCNHGCLYCNEQRHADDADLLWRERTSCLTDNVDTGVDPANGNNTRSTNVYCQTTYERPEIVSIRQCDRKIHSERNNTIVNTCRPEVMNSRCNLSSALVDQLERLCQDYTSPVYTDDAIFQNIFCYLCQGQVPVPCLEIELGDKAHPGFEFEFKLTILTDVSVDIPRKDLLVGQQAMGAHEWNQDSKVKCEKDYWKDSLKETCLPIVCAAGRELRNDTASAESYCEMEDSRDARDEIYKLNVIVYIPTTGAFSSRSTWQDSSPGSMNNKQERGTEGICSSNNIGDECHGAVFEDAMISVEDLASTSTLESRVLCEKARNSYGIKDDLSLKSRLKQNKSEGFMFEKFKRDVSNLPTFKRKAMSQLVRAYPDLNRNSKHGSLSQRTTRRAHRNKKQKSAVFKRNMIKSVKPYIISALQTLRVSDFYFQLYTVPANKPQFQNEQTARVEGVTESLHCGSHSAIGAILFVRLPSGTDRAVFESHIFHHFNGAKDIVIDTAVVHVEMVLSNSETASLIAARPLYHVNSLNRECRIFTEPDQVARLLADVFSVPGGCRVVPFNLVSFCPYVTLNISDFNISKDCELDNGAITIRKSQYIRENETINICTRTLRSLISYNSDIHLKLSLMSRIESLLTLTSLSMSLVCLLVTFITYVVFPRLRSLPGKNNMIMVTWLFIAQLLVVLNSLPRKHSTACAVMGVVLHYSWLFTVLWTCVCSFHMFHVFVIRRGVASARRSHTFYLSRYVITCSTVSSFIVLSVVFSKAYMSNYDKIGYGGHVCYLSSNVLVGVAFLLPLCVVLLFNFFFFSMTIYTISHIEDVKRHSGRERRNIHIYVRLSSLTGLTWFLALLAEIPGLQPLRCVSVFINGCQGIALFLSYVCNRRVARMWLHLIKSKSREIDRKPADSGRQVTLSSSL
ncbi:hypothetical protein BsWGS_16063 [Bradybaena similaris]